MSPGITQLTWAFVPVGLLTLVMVYYKVKTPYQLLLATFRACIQLYLLGQFLSYIFQYKNVENFLFLFTLMLSMAIATAYGRIKVRYPRLLFHMCISLLTASGLIGFYMLNVTIPQTPWYLPEKSIPLIGMLLGNSLTAISLAQESFLSGLLEQKKYILESLSLGATRWEVLSELGQKSFQMGITPIINSMMVVGIVSIPGMMTGQLIAGNVPLEAAIYQILILIMILLTTVTSLLISLLLSARKISDENHIIHTQHLRRICSQ